MKKVILAVLLFIILINLALAIQGYEKTDEKVKEKIKSGEARVFIKFKEFSQEKSMRLFSSRDIKKDVVNDLGKENVLHDFGDSISAIIDKEELEKLEKDENVESIELVGVRNIFLQDSAPLINASRSWALRSNGINLTGAGKSICIIDTGINYSHPDLGGCWGNNNLSSSCKVWGGMDYCADDSSCATTDSDPMDKHGHGTHVSGIAAANGTINGVAPDARIIIIKACNSSGSCFDDAIKSGINWCVNNATLFNISVISMSLGAGLNTNYCNSDPLAANINNATRNNIPVVVAAGNDGNTTGISAPACVENASAIGSIRKDDSTLDFNRNSLVKLLAPGVAINSTYLSGYTELSGTSMSTPHAAGAFLIIKQFLNLTGQSRTPKQIEATLNNTGKILTDSTGVNYTRINIYNAIISLDNSNPNVTLVSPSNASSSSNVNQTFRCNATDLSLKNVTFYLWNASSSVRNSSSSSVAGESNSFEVNVTNISSGSYTWNCLYTDENNNRAYALSNFSLTINIIDVTLTSPSDNIFTNRNQTYSCNASSINNLINMSFYLWNASHSIQSNISLNITGTTNSSTFSYNFTREGRYAWNCLFYDNLNILGIASSNFSLTYDLTFPTLNITSPLNNTWHNAGVFNLSLNENGSCIYSLNFGINNYSMSSSDNQNFNATNLTIVEGRYNLSYYCNDSAGNLNMSSGISFNIDTAAPNISLISPADAYSITGTSSIAFEYNASDNLNITSCELILNNASVASNASAISNGTNNITYSVSPGSYSWGINCTDQVGNIGNSSLRSLTVNSASSSVSSSSGGGGSITESAKTYNITREEASSGVTKELKKKDKIKFEIFDEKFVQHTLIVESVKENSVNISILEDKFYVVLGIGQAIKINLSSSEYYELFLRLDEIIGDKAKLTIQTIKEPIQRVDITGKAVEEGDKTNNVETDKTTKKVFGYWYFIYAIAILALVVLIIKIMYFWNKKKMKAEIMKELKKEIKRKRK